MKNKILKSILVVLFLFLGSCVRAAGYDFFVDARSAETAEDGGEQFPWKTIAAATNYIENNGLKGKTVFVKNGTYAESVALSGNTKLIGESESGTVVDADGKNNAVNFFSTASEIKNLTLKNAEATNVIVDKKSKATISHCTIEKAGKYGIEVKESTATEKYKFTVENSTVSDSGSQGVYILRRKISLTNNEIFDNEEEGIDLHQNVKGKVSGNHTHGNHESGVESILSGASLTLRGNKVENNHTQGITVQIYSASKGGKVKISGNTIEGNSDYGIRFANYTHKLGPQKFRKFAKKYVKESKNSFKDNEKGKLLYE